MPPLLAVLRGVLTRLSGEARALGLVLAAERRSNTESPPVRGLLGLFAVEPGGGKSPLVLFRGVFAALLGQVSATPAPLAPLILRVLMRLISAPLTTAWMLVTLPSSILWRRARKDTGERSTLLLFACDTLESSCGSVGAPPVSALDDAGGGRQVEAATVLAATVMRACRTARLLDKRRIY